MSNAERKPDWSKVTLRTATPRQIAGMRSAWKRIRIKLGVEGNKSPITLATHATRFWAE